MSSTEPGALRRFSSSSIGPPALMLFAAVVGLVWANVDSSTYEAVLSHRVAVSLGPIRVEEEIHGWINEALMTLFFFAVGLEIKRELAVGELQDLRRAALPGFAAIGGMIVPAAIYLLVNRLMPSGESSGWAVPVATDIAFTLGVLSLLGSRVPVHLRLFVLTLAIVDDIGGIVIIAVVFSEGFDPAFLAATAAPLLAMTTMRRLGIVRPSAYIPFGVATWYLAWRAGIEPTIAGVVVGMITPAHPVRGRDVLERLEHTLQPINAIAVLPIFAIANMGIPLSSDVLADAASSPISLGIIAGLVIGKPIGIVAATALAMRTGVGQLHSSVPPTLIPPAAALAGIGFTVALFISDLSFTDDSTLLDQAKIGVLFGSLVAAVIGFATFRRAQRVAPPRPADDEVVA